MPSDNPTLPEKSAKRYVFLASATMLILSPRATAGHVYVPYLHADERTGRGHTCGAMLTSGSCKYETRIAPVAQTPLTVVSLGSACACAKITL
jgi:hypothetical protein